MFNYYFVSIFLPLILLSAVEGAPQPKVSQEEALAKASALFPIFWSDCPDGWHNYEGHCYKWFGRDRQATWFAAELTCRKEGGHLVSITDEGQSKILRGITLCLNEYWLGLVNTDYAGKLFVSPEGWSWWDESDRHNYSRMSYSNKAGLHCAYAKADGDWTNSFCSHVKRSFVCKKNFIETVDSEAAAASGRKASYSLPTRGPDLCPQNWIFYNNNCYWFSNYSVNYFHAQLHCQDFSAQVTTVHGIQEQAFLQALNGCEKPFWIGLEMTKPCLSNEKGECWEWIDMSKVIYQNWKKGNPAANNHECVVSKGYWENSVPCANKHQFVCKRPSHR